MCYNTSKWTYEYAWSESWWLYWLAKSLEDNTIDCTVTSPPYNKGGIGGGLFRKIEYQDFDDTLPEDVYQEKQIELLNILFDKTKEGGSLFYNHKVRYLHGKSISPWQWLTDTQWHIREEIIWNRGSGPEISGYRYIPVSYTHLTLPTTPYV